MLIRMLLLVAPMALLVACAGGPSVDRAGVYRIGASDRAEVQFRMLDAVNALRAGRGAGPVTLNPQLTAAAETHARDMSNQQRAWPFGSDASSPYARVRRAGYGGTLIAEVYAQTYETELETLAAWVDDGAWGAEILDPEATEMGFGWKQDRSGLIWWAIVLGDGRAVPDAGAAF